MYVYLALLLGIVLVVWIYRRYLRSIGRTEMYIEPFVAPTNIYTPNKTYNVFGYYEASDGTKYESIVAKCWTIGKKVYSGETEMRDIITQNPNDTSINTGGYTSYKYNSTNYKRPAITNGILTIYDNTTNAQTGGICTAAPSAVNTFTHLSDTLCIFPICVQINRGSLGDSRLALQTECTDMNNPNRFQLRPVPDPAYTLIPVARKYNGNIALDYGYNMYRANETINGVTATYGTAGIICGNNDFNTCMNTGMNGGSYFYAFANSMSEYRPATQEELTWLRCQTGTLSSILYEAYDYSNRIYNIPEEMIETTGSPIQWIVGPHPDKSTQMETSAAKWGKYSKVGYPFTTSGYADKRWIIYDTGAGYWTYFFIVGKVYSLYSTNASQIGTFRSTVTAPTAIKEVSIKSSDHSTNIQKLQDLCNKYKLVFSYDTYQIINGSNNNSYYITSKTLHETIMNMYNNIKYSPIASITDTDKNTDATAFLNIFKTSIFYGSMRITGCDKTGCKSSVDALKSTYTAYTLTDISACTVCVESDFTDVSNSWTPAKQPLTVTQDATDKYKFNVMLPGSTTLPTAAVSEAAEYKIHLIQTFPDSSSNSGENDILGSIQTVHDDNATSNTLVIPKNTVLRGLQINANENKLYALGPNNTIISTVTPLIITKNILEQLQGDKTYNPNYTLRIYKKPAGGWPDLGVSTGLIFENTNAFPIDIRRDFSYNLVPIANQPYTYKATFSNNSVLPLSSNPNPYKVSIYHGPSIRQLRIIDQFDTAATANISEYTIKLADVIVTSIGTNTRTYPESVLDTSDNIVRITILDNVTGYYIMPMNDFILQAFTKTPVTSGLDYTITFNNGFTMSSTNRQILKLTLDSAIDTTETYTDVNGVKVTLNDASGYVSYNYYKTDKNLTGVVKQFAMHYLYNTARTATVSLSFGDRTFVSDTITIPSTELTIDKGNASGGTTVSGKFMMNSNNPVVLPVGRYVISVRSSVMTRTGSASGSSTETATQTIEHTSNTEIAFTTPLHSYAIDTVGQAILFYGKNAPNTVIQTIPLINDFNRKLSQEERSIQIDVSGVGTTIGPFTTRYIQLGGIYLIGAAAMTDVGYVISGNIMQDGKPVALTNLNYTIAFNNNADTLFNIFSNELSDATRYELNITKNTITFFKSDNTIRKSLTFPTSFITQLSSTTNTSLDIVLNRTIKLDKTITIEAPKFTITQTAENPEVYEYVLPEPYVLITAPATEYELTLSSGVLDNATGKMPNYGVMKFKPTAPTRKFTINVNTGEVAFISTRGATINRFDVQGLRDSGLAGQTSRDLDVKLKMNGVDFPLDTTSAKATIKPTQFNPVGDSAIYSGSDESTNVRVDFGAKSGSLSGSSIPGSSITPVSQLEPNTDYVITVNRKATGELFKAAFKSGSLTETKTIAAVNYNRDANTVTFLTAAGARVGPELVSSLPKTGSSAPELRRMNDEKITIEITQLVNYTGTANSASDGTVVPASTPPVSKTIFKQTNDAALGTQVVETSWNVGEVIFTLRNTTFNKTTQLPPGNYTLTITINAKPVSITLDPSGAISRMRLNVFTGKLVAITNTGAEVIIQDNTGILATTTPLSISASISLGGSQLYQAKSDPTTKEISTITIPAVYESCATNNPTETDVFLLLDGATKAGFKRDDASKITLPTGVLPATLADVKAAAKGKNNFGGANWDTPGWILGDIDKPPVYPVNEYSEIQKYLVPHRASFATNAAPGPVPKGPYVISYLPPDGKAGILAKGDRKAAATAGFTVVKFNTYTGQESFDTVAPTNEIFYVNLPNKSTFEDAREKCKTFGGDVALTSTVDEFGKSTPIGAQWPMLGAMYKLFASGDKNNLITIGHPSIPYKDDNGKVLGVRITDISKTMTDQVLNGVICYGSKKNIDRTKYEAIYDLSGVLTKGTVSDYNYDRHIWSKQNDVPYNTYIPKNIDAIAKEENAYFKAAMIVNDGREQKNIVFVRNLEDAERYNGCDTRNMTCIATSDGDSEIERKYTAPTSSTGKWTNLDLEDATLYKSTTKDGFQGQRDTPLPAPGMARMMSDMELFSRAPVSVEGLVGMSTELAGEGDSGRPQIPVREAFVSQGGVDNATRQAVIDILNCQKAGGAVNLTEDPNVYPGCDTICCFPDDGRQLDPSLIKNWRKTSGPGAPTCDDEGGCAEPASKALIRHTPAHAGYRLKRKGGAGPAAAPAPKCASTGATPLRTQVANAKSQKLQTLRNQPVN